MITNRLIQKILEQYSLPWSGLHGLAHWARVLENGRHLAQYTGAKLGVVELFSVFHDSKRVSEGLDYNHGQRAADYATTLRGTLFDLSDEDFDLFHTACVYHTDGHTEGDISVQTCWDADRLDVGRAMIKPDPKYLCTDAAKASTTIQWAHQRSCAFFIPDLINSEWACNFEMNSLAANQPNPPVFSRPLAQSKR